MKSLRSLISWSAFVLMAGLILFSALVYAVSEILLHRFVDGQLFALAETLAEIVEQHPEILTRQSGQGGAACRRSLRRSIRASGSAAFSSSVFSRRSAHLDKFQHSNAAFNSS